VLPPYFAIFESYEIIISKRTIIQIAIAHTSTMKYKILCSDIDGTLLTTKSEVSDFTISEITRIKKGTKITLVSARMPSSMHYIQEKLAINEQPIICYNGALVLDKDNQVISSTIIEITSLHELHRLSEPFEIDLGLYFQDEWYVPRNSVRVEREIHHTHVTPIIRATTDTLADWSNRNIGAHKIMMMCTKESADAILPILEEKMGEILHFYRSNDTLIEVSPKSVSKLSAIASLLSPEETLKDVVAFGDNYNDMEMLMHVGCGVAVGNAREEVKAIADYVTLPHTENGVAYFIQQNL